jgi:hypothetical protein
MLLQASDLATRALGEDTMAEISQKIDQVTEMVDDKAIEDIKSSFNAMAESDIPDDVKVCIGPCPLPSAIPDPLDGCTEQNRGSHGQDLG